MKIGIISEFKIDTVNYGNNLQAYALNKYLRDRFPGSVVETLYFKDRKDSYMREVTSYLALLRLYIGRAYWKIRGKKSSAPGLDRALIGGRLEAFHSFQKANIVLPAQGMTWERLLGSDYTTFIVGSDVVWTQSKANINKIKFLDFENMKKAAKIAYAASFGQNMIPRENRNAIRKALRSFKAISVRETSSVALLRSIGVENAVRTADPTLLLSAQEWSLLERAPRSIEIGGPFIFAYVLGISREQRALIERIGKDKGLPVVYVPYASGEKGNNEAIYGDIAVSDCSPEEWLWLINNAELVLTDSFHGVALSTVYEKKFVVLKRNYVRDINIRLTDYLASIGQIDKLIDPTEDIKLDAMQWDYTAIGAKLDEFRAFSKSFLDDALSG